MNGFESSATELGLVMMTDAARSGGAAADDIAELLRRSKAGDLAAFEQIIGLHERRVFQTALSLLLRAEDAQDAAQEVFLRFYKYLHRFDEARHLAPWLYRITVNVCRTVNRRRRKQTEVSLDELLAAGRIAALAAKPEDPLKELSLLEDQRFIVEALNRLPDKERAAFVLRDLQGISTREVARILGSSETTVRSQVSSARVKLKKSRDKLLGSKR